MKKVRPLIAVVDDDESVCKAIQRLLRSAGIDAIAFLSGEEFLEWLRTHTTDCLILDLHMPGVTGFDVMATISASDLDVPVVIITGHDSKEAYDRAMASGARTFLRKPVNEDALLSAVGAAVDSKEK